MYHQRQETSSRNKFREHEGAGTLNDNCCHQPQKEKMKWINFLGLEINTKTGKRRKKGVIANQTRKKYCGDIFVFRFLRCWRNFFTEQASQHLRFWAGETVRQKNDMNTLNIMVAVEHDMQEMQLKCDRWVWWPTTKMLWRARRWVCDPGCSRKKGENQVRKKRGHCIFQQKHLHQNQRCTFWEQPGNKWLAQSTVIGHYRYTQKILGTKLICSDLICNHHQKKVHLVLQLMDSTKKLIGGGLAGFDGGESLTVGKIQQKRQRQKMLKKRQKRWITCWQVE